MYHFDDSLLAAEESLPVLPLTGLAHTLVQLDAGSQPVVDELLNLGTFKTQVA